MTISLAVKTFLSDLSEKFDRFDFIKSDTGDVKAVYDPSLDFNSAYVQSKLLINDADSKVLSNTDYKKKPNPWVLMSWNRYGVQLDEKFQQKKFKLLKPIVDDNLSYEQYSAILVTMPVTVSMYTNKGNEAEDLEEFIIAKMLGGYVCKNNIPNFGEFTVAVSNPSLVGASRMDTKSYGSLFNIQFDVQLNFFVLVDDLVKCKVVKKIIASVNVGTPIEYDVDIVYSKNIN